jgi:DNA-directed RNA polymerases I, II, and III subunit RPABC1
MSTLLTKLYQSRKIILEMLELRDYDVKSYNNFTINEIDLMIKNSSKKLEATNNTLDIIVNHKTNDSKIFVKYILFTKIRPNNLKVLIDEMIEELEPNINDTIIFISKDKLNNIESFDTIFNCYDNVFLQIFELYKLLINISKHVLVPQLKILNKDETSLVLKKYNTNNLNNFHVIKLSDPQAKFYGVRKYDLCEITRPSETSGVYKSYRYCL